MNKKRFFKLLAAAWIVLLPVSSFAEELPPLPKGPLILTSVKPEQLKPEYWIKRLPDANKVLKTPKELESFNQDIRAIVRDQVDIFSLPSKRKGARIREVIELQYETLKGRKLFGLDDKYIQPDFFEREVKPVENWEGIPETIETRWGAAVRQASVRALPTDVKMLEEKGDIEFDQLQFTQIKLWTPVAILHESSDGKWYFIQAMYARGWIKSEDVAVFKNRNPLKKYAKSSSFLVVTGESVPVYADSAFTRKLQSPSMGTLINLESVTPDAYAVRLPKRKEDGSAMLKRAYIKASADVSTDFLPFTQANIIRQAFKLLGARYGWGGTYNGRDCSGFTQDVFLGMGVEMPRGSKEQSFTGTQLDHYAYKEDTEKKKEMLDNAVPGITLLRMPHHMMIFLGKDNGQYYVIHCTWAERYSMTSDAKNRINQVVVSDLTLNGKSYLGGLFERIISANEIN